MATTQERRARLSIDVPREARRRIHIAAAKRDQSIRDYVWQAVEARLKHEQNTIWLTNCRPPVSWR
ncbi:hypothetical protein SBA4_1000015 [Candidatus Sulfopaludibacter sp. SbA4]|nr:hypothetical protein SBA4_1000015 [Candidatus Sulfopaludibacter sp. SbA4]